VTAEVDGSDGVFRERPSETLRHCGQVNNWLMPRYRPIDAGVPVQASRSDLASLHWSTNGIAADFVLPGDAVEPINAQKYL
jgi:hypothetical protein